MLPDLIRYIETSKIRALLARTFTLAKIVAAQADFSRQEYVAKFVLIPPDL